MKPAIRKATTIIGTDEMSLVCRIRWKRAYAVKRTMISTLRWTSFAAPSFAFLVLCGCSMVNPVPDYDRAGKTIADATGSDSIYRPGEEEEAARTVRELMQEGIKVDEAVQICLINNPTLRAAFFDIGLARADLVQSGLFSNPTLALSIAFPEGGGRSNVQATFAQNIVDLWQIPIRKRSSERLLEASIFGVAKQASQLAVDTRAAYFTAVAADQAVLIADENVGIAEQLFGAAKARQQAGAVGELDVNLARGAVYSAELEKRRARLDAATARRRVAILLGLTEVADDLKFASSGLSPPSTELNAEKIVEIALANRLDVRSARLEAESNRHRIDLETAKILPEFSLGFYEERSERRALSGRKILADTARASLGSGQLTAPEIQSRGQRDRERSQEIDNIFGPAFSLTLPLFDQNQAQIAKAQFTYEQSLLRLVALEREIVQAVRQGVDQAQTTREIAEYFQTKLLPQSQSNLEFSRRSYDAGRSSLIVLLDAQRILLSTRLDAVVADRESAVATAELERLTARPLTSLLAEPISSTQPVEEKRREVIKTPTSTQPGEPP